METCIQKPPVQAIVGCNKAGEYTVSYSVGKNVWKQFSVRKTCKEAQTDQEQILSGSIILN